MASTATADPLSRQNSTVTALSLVDNLWVRLGLFWLPLALLFGGLEYLLWHTGETWPLDKVVAGQTARGSLFMRELMPQDQAQYKLQLLSGRKPRVMVLSSSRGMQIRAEMIGETGTTFLNGGGILNTLGDFENFLNGSQTGQLPEVVLLAVDIWWFNENWPEQARSFDRDGAYQWRAHLSAARKLVLDPALMKSLWASPGAAGGGFIGISATRTRSGFRADGSLEQIVPVPADPAQWKFEDREHPPVIERVRQGLLNFQESHGASAGKRLEKLSAALRRYRQKGIQVAAFAPPFSTEVYSALRTDPRHRDLLGIFQRDLPAVFRQAGVPYLDASDLTSLGLDDRYMLDGFHAAETFHLHLLRKMLDESPELKSMLPGAGAAVDNLLHSGRTNFYYIGMQAN